MTDALTEQRGGAVPPRTVPPRLRVDSLCVTFSNNRVLRDVALQVMPGEIHGLIGQNGSGKSTLAKVLTGLYRPDQGTRVAVDDVPLQLPVRPQESRERGVAVVHQSLGLIESETVLENMRIGRLQARRFSRRIDWDRERAAASEVFARLGRSVDLAARVASLREEDRATVAIARALQDAQPGNGLIIFDESTRALGRAALEHFFGILDEIVATGTAVLLITHRLEEVVDAADRVTVLRDGRVVEMGKPVAGLSEAELTAMMLGRTLAHAERPASRPDGDAPRIRVQGVTGERADDVSLHVRAGEILGVTGIAGSGYDDLPYLIGGATSASAGTVQLAAERVDLTGLTPAQAIRSGIVLVPEGREHAGLAMGLSVEENAVFPQSSLQRSSWRPLPRARERASVLDWMDRLDVRPRTPKAIVKNLSGGNQQKVLLAKWLATKPQLFVLHEPTQAVDVGARHTIVAAIRAAAGRGCAVIVAGSDENELSLLCDRILVFEHGRVRQELTDDLTPDRIVEAIYSSRPRAALRTRTATPTANSAPPSKGNPV